MSALHWRQWVIERWVLIQGVDGTCPKQKASRSSHNKKVGIITQKTEQGDRGDREKKSIVVLCVWVEQL